MMAVLAARIEASPDKPDATGVEVRTRTLADGDRGAFRREWRELNMSDLCYCQYAFAQPECRVQEIGPGVDPHFNVELICEGPIAAVTSRVGLDQFAPERLQGKTAEDIQWLGKIAARHNEIICQAASSSAVLPLRLGTVFRSRDSLQAMLVRCRSTVAKFLEQLGNRQEWGVKLYLEKRRLEPIPGHTGPPPPHYLGPPQTGTAYLTQKKAQLDGRREHARQRASDDPDGGTMFGGQSRALLPHSQSAERPDRPHRRNGLQRGFPAALFVAGKLAGDRPEFDRDVQSKGLVLEVSGPWPPYHFCPSLEL